MMKIFFTFFIFTSIITAKPQYGDKQVYSILENYCETINGFPNLLGIHIYNDKEGKVLQLDLEAQKTNQKSSVLMGMKAMSLVGQYSKTPFYKFILIAHYPEPKVPSGFESSAECAINFFVKQEISESSWRKDCLNTGILQRKIDNWSQLNKDNQ